MAALMKYWPVLLFAFQVFSVWVCWSLRQIAKNEVEKIAAAWKLALDAAVGELRATDNEICDDVERHEGRITRLEEGLKALPQRDDFERLEGEVKAVAREVAALRATQEAHRDSNVQAQASVDRLYQYLLTNGRTA